MQLENSLDSQVERAVLELRRRIMSGQVRPGERVAEIPFAADLGISRTPVRLALGILERDGLLIGQPRRGFLVRAFSMREILQALSLQGALEAMACSTVARSGLDAATLEILEACVEEGERIVSQSGISEGDATCWADMNGRFHSALVAAADDAPLARAIEQNARLPFVNARALAFASNTLDVSFRRMRAAQTEHVELLGALKDGDPARANWLMQEHAYKSARALRMKIDLARSSAQHVMVPGLELVVD